MTIADQLNRYIATAALDFVVYDSPPYLVHVYERGTRTVAHDPQRKVDEGMPHRTLDQARDEAERRALRYENALSLLGGR